MSTRSVFVLGGAASGKSLWAEQWVEGTGLPMTYLATGQIFDAEVAARVEVHKNRRDARWTTVEEPLELGQVLADAAQGSVLLIDCATMWLSNHMMNESDLAQAQARFIAGLATTRAHWAVVSNEVGHGIVPDNAMARQFREAQGRLNIALAAQAENAVQIIAGLPQVLKGTLA